MSGVLASAVEAISRPFVSLFEKSGTGMVSSGLAQRAPVRGGSHEHKGGVGTLVPTGQDTTQLRPC